MLVADLYAQGFANSLYPDQAPKNVMLDLRTNLFDNAIPFLQNVEENTVFNKSFEITVYEKIYPACKGLRTKGLIKEPSNVLLCSIHTLLYSDWAVVALTLFFLILTC